ncbi:MAG TPA: NADH-quinone oxidoreductase subunit NuoE [Nitrospiraceae bacterium]|nr:NADH-quinone oxidoreductase subunit NuoE [Nitrospiraceae bacterium]HAS55009.1 NADH-quinone oxidoreductase subunit NuoE [Nitrospiraceae bacterium]
MPQPQKFSREVLTVLQKEELKKVDAVLDDAAGQRGILIAVLQRVQEKLGYLPEEAMQIISERLALSLTNVYGVASFYKHFHFKPRGRNIVKVCTGTACHVRGATSVLTEMENKFGIKEGETTKDLSVTLETVGCVGCCALAPVVTVNDKDLYGELTPKMVDDIIEMVRSEHGTRV